jgi:hypothetical protein
MQRNQQIMQHNQHVQRNQQMIQGHCNRQSWQQACCRGHTRQTPALSLGTAESADSESDALHMSGLGMGLPDLGLLRQYLLLTMNYCKFSAHSISNEWTFSPAPPPPPSPPPPRPSPPPPPPFFSL